ncbi:MAG: malonyl-ACP O-methyltransferase BioC [Gammaproteobacteria bacterium]|nr:malonyl-ACP O-methyltransferase BioC [Gammaproteobacteria bacterium]
MADLLTLDKRRLRESFERAAGTYDSAAVLQREIADRMLARSEVIKLAPRVILDVGCGTGYDLAKLSQHYRQARLIGVDIAQAMTRHARAKSGWWNRFTQRIAFIGGDAEQLPLAAASVDMLFSNLALQWCDPLRVFAEARRVLRPGGLIMFSSFGPDTLRELRQAWQAADNAPHVHGFIDMHDLGDMLIHAGFTDPVMDMERFTLTYSGVMDVLRDLKRLGAHNAAVGRTRGLTGKARFARFRAAYEALAQAGKIPATYEAVYGHAWIPEANHERSADGVSVVSMQGLRRKSP